MTIAKRKASALLGGQVNQFPGAAALPVQDMDFSMVAQAAPPGALDMLRDMAQTLRDKLAAASRASDALDVANADLSRFQLVDIPDAMQLAGVQDFTLLDGAKLLLKEEVQCSITVANRGVAHQWLRDHGNGAMIKLILEVDVRVLTPAKLEALEKKIVAAGVDPERKESVHHSTLKSFVKETLEAGTTLPPAFSVHQFKKADLKETKVK